MVVAKPLNRLLYGDVYAPAHWKTLDNEEKEYSENLEGLRFHLRHGHTEMALERLVHVLDDNYRVTSSELSRLDSSDRFYLQLLRLYCTIMENICNTGVGIGVIWVAVPALGSLSELFLGLAIIIIATWKMGGSIWRAIYPLLNNSIVNWIPVVGSFTTCTIKPITRALDRAELRMKVKANAPPWRADGKFYVSDWLNEILRGGTVDCHPSFRRDIMHEGD